MTSNTETFDEIATTDMSLYSAMKHIADILFEIFGIRVKIRNLLTAMDILQFREGGRFFIPISCKKLLNKKAEISAFIKIIQWEEFSALLLIRHVIEIPYPSFVSDFIIGNVTSMNAQNDDKNYKRPLQMEEKINIEEREVIGRIYLSQVVGDISHLYGDDLFLALQKHWNNFERSKNRILEDASVDFMEELKVNIMPSWVGFSVISFVLDMLDKMMTFVLSSRIANGPITYAIRVEFEDKDVEKKKKKKKNRKRSEKKRCEMELTREEIDLFSVDVLPPEKRKTLSAPNFKSLQDLCCKLLHSKAK
jgi:hypothetical protein